MSERLRCTKHTNRHYDKNNCHACRLDEIATLKNKVVGMENTNTDLQRQLEEAEKVIEISATYWTEFGMVTVHEAALKYRAKYPKGVGE